KMNEDLKNEIKEKLKIADELRVKNLQLADAQKLSKIGSWDWNLLTNNISGSDELFNIYGFNNNNFAMEDFFAKVHPSDLEYVQSNIAESINSKKPFNIFFRYLPINGETRYINKIGRVVLNEQN